MKNYKTNKAHISKKNFYIAVIFVILSTILIVAVSFKRSLRSSRQPVVRMENSEIVPTHQTIDDLRRDNLSGSTREKSSKAKPVEDRPDPKANNKIETKADNKSENKAAVKSDNKSEANKQSNAGDKEDKSKKSNVKAAEKAVNEEKKPPVATKVSKFTKPIEGTIITEFSGDNLVESKTLKEFRTHNGIDIEALPSTPIKNICDGKVVSISNDEGRWGTCIEIEHEGGLRSIYAGLNENVNVKIDSKVKAGEVIGSLGKSNVIEGGESSHLHLELKKNDNYLNPLDYIKY